MRLDHVSDLSQFIDELKEESDRGLPLVGSSLIDEKLLKTLKAFLVEGKTTNRLLTGYNAPLGSFSSRTDACFALGLIDDYEYHEINIIRKIRNEFAHSKHGISFQTDNIQGYCSSLKSNLPGGNDYNTNNPRFRLINSIVSIVLRLYYRPEWVKIEKRKPKVWVDPEATKWRSVEDELPPEGMPVIVMAKDNSD